MKNDIIKQIKAEFRIVASDKQAELDAAYYRELAKNPKAVRKIYTPPNIQKECTKRLKELSGLPANTPKENKIPDFKKIYDKLEKYILTFPEQKNLVLSGSAGTGKTYAAQVIGNRLLEKGFSVMYITAFSLIQKFKDFIFEHSPIDWFLTCDLLIIDDLGTEPKIKNISDEYLLNVINERIANNNPFIITTNLSPEDILARYDERLTSRILSKQSSVVIEMKSKDLRLG